LPNLVAKQGRSPLVWLFFGLKGRISRRVYWMAYVFLLCINLLLLRQLGDPEEVSAHPLAFAIGMPVAFAAFYANIAVATKRLQDGGYWGGYSLTPIALFVLLVVSVAVMPSPPVVLILLASLAFTIWVGAFPGTAGPNRFGEAADIPPPP
jgi:uncharacterized membrane protein YhaH (DUF805 family)